MPGMLLAGPEVPAAQNWYRYTVKCDRAFNRRIEAAAKKAGMTPGQFVQAHFDTILDRDGAGPAIPARGTVDPVSFSRQHGVTLMAAKAFLDLAGRADENGLAKATLLVLAASAGSDNSSTGMKLRDELLEAGLLTDVQRSAGNGGSTYRIRRAG
jgi:hypothetical protein